VSNARLTRAVDHVALARSALFAAAGDLVVARYRDEMPIGEVAQDVDLELERVCELAQELERCAQNLGAATGVSPAAATEASPAAPAVTSR
jgi:hypothetical protein